MRPMILISALALAFASQATVAAERDTSELSSPIAMLTPAVAKNADTLDLNASQREAVQEWLATSPKVREALEDRMMAARAELREMIVQGETRDQREEKAIAIGEMEAKLLMMRSNCVDHWRNVLNEEQFAQALEIAGLTDTP
ncbi:hypothetical protein QC823_15730 [Halomonas vilamensis]|uniref:LTXXQ motif family protein n=1 Tax=Vreelandella vilamensis TaxID=531309 RepID=A0ABU1H863_9GAMM|nr:hypothetical protein [Halomonas vilamensis]MDR5900414.1 hypothetical protein [Halomonas vilamensis]